MAKKKSKKPKPSAKKPKDLVQVVTQKETEDKFNFGGLPDIDFKKNLGCG